MSSDGSLKWCRHGKLVHRGCSACEWAKRYDYMILENGEEKSEDRRYLVRMLSRGKFIVVAAGSIEAMKAAKRLMTEVE